MKRSMKLSCAISQWPDEDRPREKLLRQGEQCLSDSELLAIVLRTGCCGQSALDLARQILKNFKSFRQMGQSGLSEWKEFKGIGPTKVTQIKAAIEIGRRLKEQEIKSDRPVLTCSKDVADLLMPRLRDLSVEVVKVIYLNRQNEVIAVTEAEQGSVNCARPIVREIFKKALDLFASALICVHNHPGGNPLPSPEDRRFTQELVRAGEILEVAVLDHVVIGNDVYHSFSDHGELGETI